MAILVALLSATAGVAFWKITQMRQPASHSSLIVLPEPRVIADFALVDQHEQPFSLAGFRDHWTLVFFGFTHCPDVCPTALYELQQVTQLLGQDDPQIRTPQVVFVSVDPERDTPQKLEQYLAYFDPTFIGVSGAHEQLLPLTRQVGIAYRIEEHEPGTVQYGVDHSSGILLINPSARLHGVFPAPHQAKLISADILAAIEEAEAS